MIRVFPKRFLSHKVTFIGLGNMGHYMSRHLVKAGTTVFGYDVRQDIIDKFVADGGAKYDHVDDAINQSDAVLTILPNFKIVQKVWEMAYKGARKGTMFIDCSTCPPFDIADLAKQAKSRGLVPVDAPVTGAQPGAIKGTLNFLIGVEKEHFQKARDILRPMGKNFFHCGGNSMGQVAKVCNNLCLAINISGLSESIVLGQKFGMDPKLLTEVMNAGSARCWSIDTYNPVPGAVATAPSTNDYKPGFANELMCKDVNIANDAIDKLKIHAPLSRKTKEIYEALKKEVPEKDFSYVYQYVLNKKI